MDITYRRYRLLDDFTKVSRFLTDNYSLTDCSGYLPQPFFEYAHTHPYFEHKLTYRFGIWENELSIIKDGKRILGIWVTDRQKEHIRLLEDNGYTKAYEEAVTVFDYDKGFGDYSLPDGYEAFSLSEENDIKKIHRCLHKGFDHPGEPDDDIDCRLLMQSGPGFRPDLATVIKAPDGEYVCYAGMWTDKINGYAYLEPLATVPEHRRKKLAAYALTESMKKTAKEGARYCFGGDKDFYTSM